MSAFKYKRNRMPLPPLVLRAVIIIVSVLVLFLIARSIFRGSKVPAISPEVVTYMTYSKGALVRKIIELETTLESYNAQLSAVNLLEAENKQLKEEWGRHEFAKGILAHVLTPPSRSFYDTVLIDAGSIDGISEGQIVYAFNRIALGSISSVNEHQSTVLLFSAPDRETSGTSVEGDVSLKLIGRGGGEYEVHMPRDIKFDVGSVIAYQSTTPTVLAQIERIVTDPRDPFQKLLAKAPVNLQSLKWVVVK